MRHTWLRAVLLVLSVALPRGVTSQTAAFEGWSEIVGSRDLSGGSFGNSIALSRDTMAVGAPRASDGGAVYIFERDRESPGSWVKVRRLTGDPGDGYASFGTSVALDGDILLVGAPDEMHGDRWGAVYVFYRNHLGPERWGRIQRLESSAGEFGRSVSLHGGTAAVGASSEVHILERNRGGPNRWYGVTIAQFGTYSVKVSISGDTVLAAETEEISLGVPGYVHHLFVRDDRSVAGWAEIGTPLRDSRQPGVLAGSTVAIADEGLLYLYERDLGGRNGWGLWGHVDTSAGFPASLLEVPVAVRANTLAAMGRMEETDGTIRRAIFVFDRHAGGVSRWHPVDRLVGDVPGPGDLGALTLGSRELLTGFPWRAGETGLPDRVLAYRRRPILADDCESAETSAWDRTRGKVEVVRPGLDGSGHALEITVDGKRRRSYLRSRRPVAERTLSMGLTFLANEVDLDEKRLTILRWAGTGRPVKLTLEDTGDRYALGLWAKLPGGGNRLVGLTEIPRRKEVRLGLEWERATGRGHHNGRLRLLKNGRIVAEALDLDTPNVIIGSVELGLPAGSKGAAGGSFLVDEIVIHR